MRFARRAALVAVSAVLWVGCSRTERPEPEPLRPATTGVEATAGRDAASTGSGSPFVLARGVRIVHAGAGDVAKVVGDERERAKADGRDLVVYVGATWCEPCKHFHRAAQAGELDGEFPNLTLLEFDLDADRDRLDAAGYASQFIPLFAMPGPDGRASNRKFEGSVKGGGAVANIAPRLHTLLGK